MLARPRPRPPLRPQVCLGNLPSLDLKYTTFGKMLKGDDTLRKIAAAKTVKGDIPFERQGIEKVTVL